MEQPGRFESCPPHVDEVNLVELPNDDLADALVVIVWALHNESGSLTNVEWAALIREASVRLRLRQ